MSKINFGNKGLCRVRGSGETSKQILETPLNGLFFHEGRESNYIKRLAHTLNRSDIQFKPAYFLENLGHFVGVTYSGITIDHAVCLTRLQEATLMYLLPRVGAR